MPLETDKEKLLRTHQCAKNKLANSMICQVLLNIPSRRGQEKKRKVPMVGGF